MLADIESARWFFKGINNGNKDQCEVKKWFLLITISFHLDILLFS